MKTHKDWWKNNIQFIFPLKFASKIYRRDLTLQKAEDGLQDLKILINKLNNDYNPTSKIKIKEKDDTLKTARILCSIRNDIINAFRKDIFPYIDGFQVKEEEIDKEMKTTIIPELESEESAGWTKKKSTTIRHKNTNTKPNAK